MAIVVWVSALLIGSALTCLFMFSTVFEGPTPAPFVASANATLFQAPGPAAAASPAHPREPRIVPSSPNATPWRVNHATPALASPPMRNVTPAPDRRPPVSPTAPPVRDYPTLGSASAFDDAPSNAPALRSEHETIGDQAVRWLEVHATQVLGSTEDTQMVVDYGFKHPYRLPARLPATWTWLTAPLPGRAGVAAVPWPRNQILWAPPTAHRVQSLCATMNYFSWQLLLHLEEMLALPDMAGLHSLRGAEVLKEYGFGSAFVGRQACA